MLGYSRSGSALRVAYNLPYRAKTVIGAAVRVICSWLPSVGWEALRLDIQRRDPGWRGQFSVLG